MITKHAENELMTGNRGWGQRKPVSQPPPTPAPGLSKEDMPFAFGVPHETAKPRQTVPNRVPVPPPYYSEKDSDSVYPPVVQAPIPSFSTVLGDAARGGMPIGSLKETALKTLDSYLHPHPDTPPVVYGPRTTYAVPIKDTLYDTAAGPVIPQSDTEANLTGFGPIDVLTGGTSTAMVLGGHKLPGISKALGPVSSAVFPASSAKNALVGGLGSVQKSPLQKSLSIAQDAFYAASPWLLRVNPVTAKLTLAYFAYDMTKNIPHEIARTREIARFTKQPLAVRAEEWWNEKRSEVSRLQKAGVRDVHKNPALALSLNLNLFVDSRANELQFASGQKEKYRSLMQALIFNPEEVSLDHLHPDTANQLRADADLFKRTMTSAYQNVILKVLGNS